MIDGIFYYFFYEHKIVKNVNFGVNVRSTQEKYSSGRCSTEANQRPISHKLLFSNYII